MRFANAFSASAALRVGHAWALGQRISVRPDSEALPQDDTRSFLPCPACDRAFATAAALQSHQRAKGHGNGKTSAKRSRDAVASPEQREAKKRREKLMEDMALWEAREEMDREASGLSTEAWRYCSELCDGEFASDEHCFGDYRY